MTDMEEAWHVASKYIMARLESFGEHYPSNGTEFDFDEFQVVQDYVHEQFEGKTGAILSAYVSMQKEFARGHRCAVCGRTTAQNAAIGYNCTEEC